MGYGWGEGSEPGQGQGMLKKPACPRPLSRPGRGKEPRGWVVGGRPPCNEL